MERSKTTNFVLNTMSVNHYFYILDFVQTHHKFGRVPKEYLLTVDGQKHFLNIKYINTKYDVRTGTVWQIEFICIGGVKYVFDSTKFASTQNFPPDFTYHSLYEWVIDFLKGKHKPS